MRSSRQFNIGLGATWLVIGGFFFYFHFDNQEESLERLGGSARTPKYEMGAHRDEESPTQWYPSPTRIWSADLLLYRLGPRTSQIAIYTVDDPNSTTTLHTSVNKGREAVPYLTYLVDNYNFLPSTIIFLHAHRKGYPEAWHNDAPNYDNVVALQTLNIKYIQENGYANLRCIGDPGCPGEVQPFRDPPEEHRTIEAAMPDAWQDLFGNTDVPHTLATPCCGQFAVSKSQVLKRPRSDYQKYLDWLLHTSLKDETSGRVFEYLWHIIFGQEPI
ncbi:hypothetical protein K505DRAFT_415023 [Melanomma pulvis-pyrius CBS 109.77]|uniref:Uncharacterized protein n=1 Tax=Melanomma pulvis-pyrius CBS 109.77 TaxID=1314802 RepID=A0A6A6XMC0_9PLEO|nr:hypothetical protein K505DRAFT_415023 [Melanomma pulvis-pyrius CBS 109.77]